MDEDSIIIGVTVGVMVLLSPIMLYWTVALFDTVGVDGYLPDVAFIALSAFVPVLIVCFLSYLVMRHFNRPYDWIKEKLTFVAVFLFAALFMLLSMMGFV
jgi:multisubunit Na+/H+ antiporter MnhB subunit